MGTRGRNRVVWRGIEELGGALTLLTPELTAQALRIEAAIAAQTAGELRAAYPVRTGALAASVRVEPAINPRTGRAATSIVAGSDYAGFFEFASRYRVPVPTFVPITRRGRAAFVAAMIALVQKAGFHIGGG